MPYQVIVEAATVPKAMNELVDDKGVKHYEHVATTYVMGTVLHDDDVSPVVKDAYDAGDEHVRGLLVKLTNAKAKEAIADGAPQSDAADGHPAETVDPNATAVPSSGSELETVAEARRARADKDD